jgi:16S rRNA (cytosine1402-N4)-methyltransferase
MSKAGGVTAAVLLNTLDENSLADIFYNFGEFTNSRKIAKAIAEARSVSPLTTANHLVKATEKFAPFRHENKFYARLFQALRIAVNREIDFLKEMLEQALQMLKSGGRLAVITYHSLEDRIVKNFFKTGNFDGIENKNFYGHIETPFGLITKKGIVPSEEEILRNNRARSARLRIAEKI